MSPSSLSNAEGGERVRDHYLLSSLNQSLVAQPPILPLPGAAQPAWLSRGKKEKKLLQGPCHYCSLVPLEYINKPSTSGIKV